MPNLMSALGVAAVAMIFALPSSASPRLTAAYAPASKAVETGPAATLATMLAQYDAMTPGTTRDALALQIDRFAGQRYATVSRLYWYQDLEAAKAAAVAAKKPILHLRMLGRLDEDLSCANSRFFRTTLYANAETSKFLRDNFVLYWSSERAVPRVTIDFGDGRKIERTTTGNSAHYVMDERGNVLDVLPGLYAPSVFRGELVKSVALAKSVRGSQQAALVDKVIAFHQREMQATATAYGKVAGLQYIRRPGRLLGRGEIGEAAVQRAQAATYAKAIVEVPDLRKIGIDAGTIDPFDRAQWSTVGQQIWNIGLDAKAKPGPQLLDAQSVALIEKVRAGNPLPLAANVLLARLEQNILADTALNEFQLRNQIRAQLVYGKNLDFNTLNEMIYARVFHTPKDDAWLGLLDQTDFTGLPADGVVMP